VQILTLLERGDIFGERALVGARAAVHCEAFEDTLVCVLRREDFEDLVRRRPELALRVVRVLAERLREAEETIERLALHDVPARLAALLLRLAEAYGEPHGDGRRLALRVTHQDLAGMIGATRETVTLTLNRFREEGLIAVEDRHIIVRDPAALAARGALATAVG
jgi:CRP/FNR family transcriptional regulator